MHRRGERASTGFSLIELMITVAIIAILAAIAIPSYQDSVWKGKRGEAKAAILRALQTEERYYTQNNTYVVYPTGNAPLNSGLPSYSTDSQSNSRYSIGVIETSLLSPSNPRTSCTESDARKCVRVVATVIGNPDPKCGAFISMDSGGVKQSALANNACWN